MNRWAGPKFPWATFTINVTGSFAIGFLTIVLARWLPHPNARLLITGLLGGSLRGVQLLEHRAGGVGVGAPLGGAAEGVGQVVAPGLRVVPRVKGGGRAVELGGRLRREPAVYDPYPYPPARRCRSANSSS